MLTRHSQNHNIILVQSYNKTMDGLVIKKKLYFHSERKKKLYFHWDRKKKLYSGVKTRTPPGYEMGGPLLQGEWINMKHVDFWQYVYYILELATRKPSFDHQKYFNIYHILNLITCIWLLSFAIQYSIFICIQLLYILYTNSNNYDLFIWK